MKLKIWSEQNDEYFTLFISHNDKTYHCAIDNESLGKNNETASQALSGILGSLCMSALPAQSRKERVQEQIKAHEQQIEFLKQTLVEG